MDSLYGVGNGLLDFGTAVIIDLPYLVVWAAVILLVILIIRLLRKRRKNKEQKKMQGKQEKDTKETATAEAANKTDMPVYTSEKGQIVFVDTPGIHKAKNRLGDYMVNVARRSLSEVDVILWLVEPSNYIGAGEESILEQLSRVNTPVILVINKIDTVKKEELLGFIDTYRKRMDFAEIVPVSALKKDNTEELLSCIFKYLPYGPAFYDEDTVTDQPQRQIVAELIREKALRTLEEEIPHGIAVTIEKMKRRGKIRDIEEMLECKVNLQLWVKVKKDWRDSEFLLKNFGYNPKDGE